MKAAAAIAATPGWDKPATVAASSTLVDSLHFGGNTEKLEALYKERKQAGYRLDHSITMQMGPQCQVVLFWELA
jgi:hypothetical protein